MKLLRPRGIPMPLPGVTGVVKHLTFAKARENALGFKSFVWFVSLKVPKDSP